MLGDFHHFIKNYEEFGSPNMLHVPSVSIEKLYETFGTLLLYQKVLYAKKHIITKQIYNFCNVLVQNYKYTY